jgi:hypothetical protein
MRKPLTDSLCAELAKDFKPFKVRRNGLKPLNGFKTSTTYTVTALRKNALHQWVVSFKNQLHDYLAENFDMIVETKAEPKRIIKGLTPSGHTLKGEFHKVDEDGFTWIQYGKSLMKLVAIETDPIQVKEIKIPSGTVKAGDVLNVIAKHRAQEIDGKLKELDGTFELEFKHFDKPKPNPDNDTIKQLVQYVSEHRDSMSKESIKHFANLIGLIKLGEL